MRQHMFRWLAIVLIALAAAPAGFGDDDDVGGWYFCEVTDVDGVKCIREMHEDDIEAMEEDLKEERERACEKWSELREKWISAVGRKRFPVPEPRRPRVRKLSTLPPSSTTRERKLEAYRDKLEIWSVCIIKDMAGAVTAKAIRRDKIRATQTKLQTEYVGAVIKWVEATNESEGEPEVVGPAPKRPSIRVVRSGIRPARDAEEFAETLARRLAERQAEAAAGAEE